MNFVPQTMNIELTTNCPLRCPQCYCSLTGGKNIPLEVAVYWIKEGIEAGIKDVMLSGGETMCYPHLYEVISTIKRLGGTANVALSGFGFNQSAFQKLIEAGIGKIFISLNGSSKEINEKTRDGFELAINALQLLKENDYKNVTINWVMHRSNADDFLNMVKLAEEYNVASMVVIGVKPDSKHELPTLPTVTQMQMVSNIIRTHNGNTKLYIESCFSPLLALASETKLFGNLNVGKSKGCGAGRTTFSVNVDGMLSPCRHLEIFEKCDSFEEYWNHSKTLRVIRNLEKEKREPCASCYFSNYCRHCLAINSKIYNSLYFGNEFCSLANFNKP